jgi:hypothetical protein
MGILQLVTVEVAVISQSVSQSVSPFFFCVYVGMNVCTFVGVLCCVHVNQSKLTLFLL